MRLSSSVRTVLAEVRSRWASDGVPARPTRPEALFRRALPVGEVVTIEQRILAASAGHFRKVALVVANAMEEGGHRSDVAVLVHCRVVARLVRRGCLEAKGNVLRPRYSEVRLCERDDSSVPLVARLVRLRKRRRT